MSAPRSLSDSVCPSDELLPVHPEHSDSALASSTPITPVRNTSSAPITPVLVSNACSGSCDISPASSSVEQKSKLLRFNLAMDLQLLRQCRIHPHLFVHGAPDMKNVAEELGQDEKFAGITKKAVCGPTQVQRQLEEAPVSEVIILVNHLHPT